MDGLWGIYAHDDGKYEFKKLEYKRKKQSYEQFKKARKWVKSRVTNRILSNDERDENLRAIIRHLGLSEDDRLELQNRGLSDEEIDNGLFATIQPLSLNYS